MATTRKIVTVTEGAWIDLQDDLSVVAGTRLISQIRSGTGSNVSFVSSVGDPGAGVDAEDSGGLQIQGIGSATDHSPGSTEKTWARAWSNSLTLNVQTVA